MLDTIPFIYSWLVQFWNTVRSSFVLSSGFMLLFVGWIINLIVGTRQD